MAEADGSGLAELRITPDTQQSSYSRRPGNHTLQDRNHVVYKCTCNWTSDTIKFIVRLKEDLNDEKDNLMPLDPTRQVYNCKTSHKEICSPRKIVEKLNEIKEKLPEFEKVFQDHIGLHADRPAQRHGLYSPNHVLPIEEESGLEDSVDDMRLRSSCSHIKSLLKILRRCNEDFKQLSENLKPQANGSINCIRNMNDSIVVGDVCQLLSDVRQQINETKRVFIEHVKVHTLIL